MARKPPGAKSRAPAQPPMTRLERLERGLAMMAYIVVKHGDVYAPLFERLEREVEAERSGPEARARRVLESYMAAGSQQISKDPTALTADALQAALAAKFNLPG